MRHKTAQATIFIIVAIAIIILIGILLFIKYGPDRLGGGAVEELEIKNYIDKCASENAANIADEMIKHGGFITTRNNTITYNNITLEYLCRNTGYFKPCVNQHGSYIFELEKELTHYLAPKIQECFEEIDKKLEKKSATLMVDMAETNVLLAPDRIIIEIRRNMSLEYKDQKYEYSIFDSEINYPLYNLGLVARDIVNNEATYCYIEYVGYVTTYPEFTIRKNVLGDSTKIYEVEHVPSGKKLKFAIRGCAIPPGI